MISFTLDERKGLTKKTESGLAMTASMRTTHLVLGMHLPGLDPGKSQKSMELFAKEVKPALR